MKPGCSKAVTALLAVILLMAPALAADDINPRGKPDVKNFKGYKVWRGERDWRIEMNAGADRLDFTGQVTCGGAGRIKSVYRVENGKRKPYGSWNDRLIRIAANPKNATVGLSFDASCARLRFDLMVNKKREPRFVLIGKGKKSPEKIPFTLKVE